MKRITLFAGHYGSGKTCIAVSYAKLIKKSGFDTSIIDLDIVNPYFRTKDSEKDLIDAGINIVASEYANTNLDAPALPKEIYSAICDKSTHLVIDVGGDDRGALALGRLTPSILEEGAYEMLLVANFFRPLTRDIDSLMEVMGEMELAAGMKFTGIVNNSNLGEETTPEDVLSTVKYARAFSERSGLPVVMTTVREDFVPALSGQIENLFPLRLQKKYY